MAYVDRFLRVSSAQSVTTTAVSTDSVDLVGRAGAGREIAEGTKVRALITLNAAATGATSVTFEIIAASDAGLVAADARIIGRSRTYTLATDALPVGSQVVVEMNPDIGDIGYVSAGPPPVYRRYIGVRYTVVGTLSTGTFTADLVLDVPDGKKFYASGIAVS